jgi:DinB superfamily
MTTDEPTYMTQHDLWERVRADRQAFARLWQELTDVQMTQYPGPQDDWSVKDLIAHITAWESDMMNRVTHLLDGGTSQPVDDLDGRNAQIFLQNRDRSLDDALAGFETNQARLQALIASLNDAQINDPARYKTYDGCALLPVLIADTFGHYAGHYDDLSVYVEPLKKPVS